jgi:hypothetical protein
MLDKPPIWYILATYLHLIGFLLRNTLNRQAHFLPLELYLKQKGLIKVRGGHKSLR